MLQILPLSWSQLLLSSFHREGKLPWQQPQYSDGLQPTNSNLHPHERSRGRSLYWMVCNNGYLPQSRFFFVFGFLDKWWEIILHGSLLFFVSCEQRHCHLFLVMFSVFLYSESPWKIEWLAVQQRTKGSRGQRAGVFLQSKNQADFLTAHYETFKFPQAWGSSLVTQSHFMCHIHLSPSVLLLWDLGGLKVGAMEIWSPGCLLCYK